MTRGILDASCRWLPPDAGRPAVDGIADRGWNVLSGDLLTPVLVLKERALAHNLRLMRRYCDESRVSIAPHAKTSMSPQIVRRQLEAGAWAITAASPGQARLLQDAGADRILIANEVVDPAGLRWLASRLSTDPSPEVISLVDSEAGVALLEAGLAVGGASRRLDVLVEVGYPGGRAGCRTLATLLKVAAAARRSRHLRLVGVETFEGLIHGPGRAPDVIAVDRLLDRVREATEALAAAGMFDGADEVIVSAGGSLYFDRVVARLGGGWNLDRPVRVLLRSGCYVTHDHGDYGRDGPLGGRAAGWEPFQPAFELWATVLSRPEPGLAIAGFGRRDASHDVALPQPLRLRSRDGGLRPAAGMRVRALNDQHAHVELEAADPAQPGDMLGCGIAHPCTIFDKWRYIPVVDDDCRVISVVETFF